MINWKQAVCCALVALICGACMDPDSPEAQDPAAVAVTGAIDEGQVLGQVAQLNRTGLAAARLALDHAQSLPVKAFAHQALAQYGAAEDRLADLAAQRQLSLPGAPDAREQEMLDRLAGLEGVAFERAYLADEQQDRERLGGMLGADAVSADPALESDVRGAYDTLRGSALPDVGATSAI